MCQGGRTELYFYPPITIATPQWFALWSHTKIKAKTWMTPVSHSGKWTIYPMKHWRGWGGGGYKAADGDDVSSPEKINAQPLPAEDSALIPPGIIYFQK